MTSESFSSFLNRKQAIRKKCLCYSESKENWLCFPLWPKFIEKMQALCYVDMKKIYIDQHLFHCWYEKAKIYMSIPNMWINGNWKKIIGAHSRTNNWSYILKERDSFFYFLIVPNLLSLFIMEIIWGCYRDWSR